jgi:c-di-GMP-binding flagellar brake protein YcgR
MRTGTRLIMKTPYTDDNGDMLTLHSRYEETIDDFDFIIEAPFYKGGYFPLPPKEALEIHFFNKDVPHSFEAVAVKRLKKENLNFVQMHRTGEVARHQLREAFRLDCALNASICVESAGDAGQNDAGQNDAAIKTIPCQIVNISYGGARIALSEPLERGAKVQLMFYTILDEVIDSEVRSVVPADSGMSRHKWFCGLQFEYEELAQSRRVSQMVNEMQRQMLKSGRRPI